MDPIQALRQELQNYTAQVAPIANDVEALKREMDAMNSTMAAMKIGGGAGGNRNDGNLAAELKALASFARTGKDDELQNIQASMSVGTDPDGGYFVLPALSDTMTKKLFDSVAMRRLARVVTITAGASWKEPIDLGEPAATWVGESQARPTTATPSIGMLEVPVREIYSLQPVTQGLIDSVGFDLGGWLNDKLSDKFSRSEDKAFISGDDVLEPQGLLTAPKSSAADDSRAWGTIQFKVTGAASGFPSSNPADVLKTLLWSLRAPYRNGASWLMSSSTMAEIDKFKDANGQYLLRPGLTAGAPTTLLGYPVEVDEDMPDIAANAFPVAFGNFRLGYVIVDRVGLRVLRDPFTSKPSVLFYAYRRVGGAVANSEAVKLLKVAAS